MEGGNSTRSIPNQQEGGKEGYPHTKEILSDPMQHLIVTPLSTICKICQDDNDEEKSRHAIFATKQKPVRNHFKKWHSNRFDINKFSNITTKLAVAKHQAVNGGWRDQTPKDAPQRVERHTVCTGCGNTFGKDSNNFKRHTNKSSTCNDSTKVKKDCILLICGGWFPIPEKAPQHFPPSLDRTIRMPASTCTTIQQYEKQLEKFVGESSTVGNYAQVLLTSVSKHGDMFGEYVKQSLQEIFGAQKKPEPVLALLNQCADKYADHVSSILAVIPGDILSTVQNFNPTSIDDSQNYRSIFSARHSYAQIKSYLHHLFAFLLIRKCPLLDPYIEDINNETGFSVEDSFQYAFIPSLLYDLSREVPPNFGEQTWLLEHAQLYCFRLSHGEPVLYGSGWGANKLSAALHTIRAGVCGMMTTKQFTTETGVAPAHEYAKQVKKCHFVNISSRWIRGLRDQYRTEMNARSIYYDPMENIVIDGIMFKKEIYSQLVPTLYNLFCEQFKLFFDGDQWKKVLDLTKGVTMKNWYKCDFTVEDCDMALLELKEDTSGGDIEKLCSILELSLFGVGLGPGRFGEVSDLLTTAFHWAYNCFYYGLVSRKRGSMKAKSADIVEHKLPPCLDRCLLLTRVIFTTMTSLTFGSKKLFPTLKNRSYSMMHLVRSIFGLKADVGNTIQVRHLFHSILNIFYPDGVSKYGHTITMPGLCVMAGHSAETGKQSYSSKPVFWREQLFVDYHYNLGDRTRVIETTIIPQSPCLESDALDILKMVFGTNASFRGERQKEAMLSVLNKPNHHRAILLECGAGKTLIAMTPTLDAHMRGMAHAMTIIVAPHIHLVGHQISHLCSLLSGINADLDNNDITVEHFTTLDSTLPSALSDDALPHVVVMSIMAFSSLVKYNINKMQWWYDHGKLGHIFLDEVQMLTGEGIIRKEYEHLSAVASIGVPVTILSGSLSVPLMNILASYLGLSSSATPIDVIKADDLVGNHFNFEVRSKPKYSINGVVEYAKERMTSCHVHIICATIKAAEDIYNNLKQLPGVAAIIGQDPSDEKMQTADRWRKGEITVMISSTCALVGNENRNCRHVMIVDQIYDLQNLLQAMGRLRVEQGGENSFVTQFLSDDEMNDDAYTSKATETKLQDLRNMKLQFDHEEDQVKMETTRHGYTTLFKAKGCLLKNLSCVFGGNRESDCKRCTNCDTTYNSSRATIRIVPSFLCPSVTNDINEVAENNADMDLQIETGSFDVEDRQAISNDQDQDQGEAEVNNIVQNLSQKTSTSPPKLTFPSRQQAGQRKLSPMFGKRLAQVKERNEKHEREEAAKKQRMHADHEREERDSNVSKTIHQNKAFSLCGNPMQQLTLAARTTETEKQSIKELASTKLALAYRRCAQCSSPTCDGVACVMKKNGRNRCINCFEPHQYKECPYKVARNETTDREGNIASTWKGNYEVTKFMMDKSRGCVICFDPNCSEQSFDPKNQHKAKKRVKGALFMEMKGGETFLATLKRCYATEHTRDQFLAKM